MKAVVISRLLYTLLLFYSFPVKTAAQNISGVINSYHRVSAINTGTNSLTLNTTAGLSVGSRVLLIQMQGASINTDNSTSFGDISALNNAGNYEFNHICGIAGNDVLLARPLLRSYTVSGSVQLVSIPFYNVATVTGTLTASPWNAASGTGGVLIFEADSVLLNNNIDVSGMGFTGGILLNYPRPPYDCSVFAPVNDYFLPLMPPIFTTPYQLSNAAPKGEGIAAFITNAEYARGKQANGGGGANNHNAGGGGGGNFGAGGLGGAKSLVTGLNCTGTNPGLGAVSLSAQGYSTSNNRIFLGGGGGAGHQNNNVGMPGGIGGGIAIITANVIVGSGTSILANGARPINSALVTDPLSAGGDGGGGGGGGGVVILDINSVNGNIIASATGGRGSDAGRTGTVTDCPGSGGGGGGGVVWMKGGSAIANVTSNIAGGTNGMGSPLSPNVSCRNTTAGAAGGTNGAVVINYTRPMGTNPGCPILPVHELKSFTGLSSEKGTQLQWQMYSVENIARFEIERTIDQVKYITIATVNADGGLNYSVNDPEKIAGTVYYRLKVIRPDNRIDYSHLVRINVYQSASFQWLSMKPNPATDKVSISLFAKQNTIATITLFNGSSQPVLKHQARLNAGYGNISIPLHNIPKGVYWMVIEANGTRLVKPMVKD